MVSVTVAVLQDIHDLVKGDLRTIGRLVVEELHGSLVELHFVDFLLDLELDLDGLTEWSTFAANKLEDGNVLLIAGVCVCVDLNGDHKLESVVSGNNEVDWESNFLEQLSAVVIVLTQQRSTCLPLPIQTVLDLDVGIDCLAWLSDKDFFWNRDDLGFLESP